MEPCECPEPGFCVRYNREMSERMHKICRGEVLTPEKCESYRQMWLRQRQREPEGATSLGVGTVLKKIVERKYKLSSHAGCQCNQRAAEMDKKGIEWCEQNKQIIAGWLTEGAAERFWLRPIARLFGGTTERIAIGLVEQAIQWAKREQQGVNLDCDTAPHSRNNLRGNVSSQVDDTSWCSAFQQRCRYFGQHLRDEPVENGPGTVLPIYQCWAQSGEEPALCTERERDRDRLKDRKLRDRVTACSTCPLYQKTPRYVSQKQLAADTLSLIGKLPPGITRVAGVSRSGLSVAAMVAKYLHLPIDIIRQTQRDIVEGGNGWRLKEGTPKTQGTVLVVDDTCMTGNSLKAITPFVQKHYHTAAQIKFATVYVNPLAKRKPDYWAVDLPHPHVLEWNLFNSVFTPACALDFDGILCQDCPPQDDDDGAHYLKFLENARPLYFVRKKAIPLIVTARLEKYRPQTLAWLKRWGMRVDRLVMGPWKTKAERSKSDIAAFKAQHFRQFMKGRFRPGPPMLVESQPGLAKRIADLSGGIVVCPGAGRCFP